MARLFNSSRRCVPSLGSQARLGQEHTGDLQKECCTNAGWIKGTLPIGNRVEFRSSYDSGMIALTAGRDGKPINSKVFYREER